MDILYYSIKHANHTENKDMFTSKKQEVKSVSSASLHDHFSLFIIHVFSTKKNPRNLNNNVCSINFLKNFSKSYKHERFPGKNMQP